jgi:hypothetical protein
MRGILSESANFAPIFLDPKVSQKDQFLSRFQQDTRFVSRSEYENLAIRIKNQPAN